MKLFHCEPRILSQPLWCAAVVAAFTLISPLQAQQPSATVTRQALSSGARTSATAHLDEQRLSYARELAGRGAVFAAAGEFESVLMSVAGRLDAQSGTRTHLDSLGAGLRALEEADDFYRIRASLDVTSGLDAAIQAHQTTVLKTVANASITPIQALQSYHAFALQHLSQSGSQDPHAAAALYGLARLQPALSLARANDQETAMGARVMTLLQAALQIDPEHYESLNELGVVFARYDRLDDAANMFRRALNIQQAPETWHNLATVLERQGQPEQAAQAKARFLQAKESSDKLILVGNDVSLPQVRWVSPAEFSSSEGPLWSNEVSQPDSALPAAQAIVAPVTKPTSEKKGVLSAIRERFSNKKQ